MASKRFYWSDVIGSEEAKTSSPPPLPETTKTRKVDRVKTRAMKKKEEAVHIHVHNNNPEPPKFQVLAEAPPVVEKEKEKETPATVFKGIVLASDSEANTVVIVTSIIIAVLFLVLVIALLVSIVVSNKTMKKSTKVLAAMKRQYYKSMIKAIRSKGNMDDGAFVELLARGIDEDDD